jgi:hypothetical protein
MYNGAKHVAIVEQLKTHRTSEFFTGTCTWVV